MPHEPDLKPRGPRIGLFGGTFDPIHAGHLHAARAAAAAFGLDRVIFVPAARSPHKLERDLAPDRDRLAMVELAIRGEPRLESSALEIERGGSSYTIDTVRALPRAIGAPPDCDLYLIIGSDNLNAIATWREAPALLERVQPIVVHRHGEPDALIDAVRARLGDALAEKVRAGYLRLAPVEVSSTELRSSLASDRVDGHALPAGVHDYIRAHGLYGVSR